MCADGEVGSHGASQPGLEGNEKGEGRWMIREGRIGRKVCGGDKRWRKGEKEKFGR